MNKAKDRSSFNPSVLFVTLMIMFAIAMAVMSFDFGVNGDEHAHLKYGRKLLSFYMTFGENEESLDFLKQHYYGGFFDLPAEILINTVEQIKGYDFLFEEYQVRHMLNSLFGMIAVLFTVLLAKQLGGWKAAFIALLFLMVSARFLGHSMNNSKDIPFATGYIIAIFFMIRTFSNYPVFRKVNVAGLIFGIGLAFGMRAGGLILICYLLLFWFLYEVLLNVNNKENFLSDNKVRSRRLFKIVGISLAGYMLGLLFWPYGLVSPIEHPLETLQLFSKFPHKIPVLFEGRMFISDALPWYFVPKWIAITIPVIVLAGSILFVILIWWISKRYGLFNVFIILFVTIFPVAYAIYQDAVLYAEWRHFLFIYPTFIVLAALSFNYLYELIPKKAGKLTFASIIILSSLYPGYWMMSNYPHWYVYFNPLVGGLEGAYGNYDTDYYMHSTKYASEWLKPQLRGDEKVITTCGPAVRVYFNEYSDEKIPSHFYWGYLLQDWDYAIINSRYLPPEYIKNGNWPPENTIYAIEAEGVPLSAIVERKDRSYLRAVNMIRSNKIDEAYNLLQPKLTGDPHELGYLLLGTMYFETGQYKKAINSLNKGLEIYPDHPIGLNVLGNSYLNLKYIDRAILILENLNRVAPKYPVGIYSLGYAYYKKGKYNKAIEYIKESIRRRPDNINGYKLLAKIFNENGQPEVAENILQNMRQNVK